jgi:membrane protein DedA with SNARE-associated domain
MDTEAIIAATSYLGIFALMVSNGIIPFPSSQILYIIVGYFVSTGTLGLLPASLIGAIGNTVGNIVLYEGVRRHGIRFVERFEVFRKDDIKKVEILFRKRGVWFLFIGKLLPAIKIFVPIPAGLGKVHRGAFTTIMLLSSWLWSLVFIAIGYYFGKSTTVWKSYGTILAIVALVIVFLFYRMLNSKEVLDELKRSS